MEPVGTWLRRHGRPGLNVERRLQDGPAILDPSPDNQAGLYGGSPASSARLTLKGLTEFHDTGKRVVAHPARMTIGHQVVRFRTDQQLVGEIESVLTDDGADVGEFG